MTDRHHTAGAMLLGLWALLVLGFGALSWGLHDGRILVVALPASVGVLSGGILLYRGGLARRPGLRDAAGTGKPPPSR